MDPSHLRLPFSHIICTIVHDLTSFIIYFKILSYAIVHSAFLSLVDYNNSSSYISKKKNNKLYFRFGWQDLNLKHFQKEPNFLMYIHHMYHQHESVRIIYKKCVGSSTSFSIYSFCFVFEEVKSDFDRTI